MSIRSAIVTIEDPVAPLVSEPTGPLTEDRWHSGTEAVTFSGSDVTGIRQVGVFKGATAVGMRTAGSAQAGGCGQLNVGLAYTFTKPCEGTRGVNGPQSLDLNTVGLGDGTSVLRLVARDTAGNEAARELSVKVDNTAPGAPELLADGEWSSAADAIWSWHGSAEADRAPVDTVEVERCLGAQGCAVEALTGDDFGGVQSYSHPVPEGESTLRVRETDAAGNVGSWSTPLKVRRDRTPPVVTVVAPGRAVAGQAVSPDVTAADALSGTASIEVEVRADGGAWRPATSPETAPGGTVLRFRARARDRAQNAGGWVESGDLRFEDEPLSQPPVATPAPAPVAERPPPATKRATRIVIRTQRLVRGRLVLRGRVVPSTATGVIQVRVAGRRATRRLRGAAFAVSLKVKRRSARAAMSYRGDAAHAPATRRLRFRTAR